MSEECHHANAILDVTPSAFCEETARPSRQQDN
jgi:hypothetical protein